MITSSAAAFVLTAVMGTVGLVVVGVVAAPAAAAVAAAVPGRGPGGVGVGNVGNDGRTTFVWGRSVVGPPTRLVAGVVVVVVVTAPVAVAAAGLVAAASRVVAGWVRLVAVAVKLVTRGPGAAVVGGVRSGTSGVGTGATFVDSDRIGRGGTCTGPPRLVLVACPKALNTRARVVSNVKVFIFGFRELCAPCAFQPPRRRVRPGRCVCVWRCGPACGLVCSLGWRGSPGWWLFGKARDERHATLEFHPGGIAAKSHAPHPYQGAACSQVV